MTSEISSANHTAERDTVVMAVIAVLIVAVIYASLEILGNKPVGTLENYILGVWTVAAYCLFYYMKHPRSDL